MGINLSQYSKTIPFEMGLTFFSIRVPKQTIRFDLILSAHRTAGFYFQF